MRPITKNIIVVDENGKEYTSTYAKRAKGLVKNGRARWLDGNTICLVCPPDTLNLEDNDMLNNAENMETINEVCENEVKTEGLKSEQPAVTAADILSRIDRIIEQGEEVRNVITQIQNLPVNDSPYGGEDGARRADAIGNIYKARESTNQRLIDLLNRMYDDIAPKQAPEDAKIKAIEKLAKMNFAGVMPGTAEMILNFINSTLM